MDATALYVFQMGFNYSQDGAGNRLVYHLRGCNLRCPWCSNPEGMDFARPGDAAVTTEDLVARALRSKPMFFDGGGVTFTGGEATCQFEGLKEALTALKEAGLNTCLETNGTSPRLPELFPLVDELIMDFKHYDSEKHRAVIGTGNEVIAANLKEAFARHPDLLVRTPLIGGFNAAEEDNARFIRFYRTQPTQHARFELLLYHEFGRDKWAQCGKVYTVRNAFVQEDVRKRYEAAMRDAGLTVVRT